MYWQFDNNTEHKNARICRFKENNALINFTKNLLIEEIPLKDIFDQQLYTDLYVF